MKDFNLVNSQNQSILILKEVEVTSWTKIADLAEGGFDETGHLVQIKATKIIKIIPITTQAKIEKSSLILGLGSENFAYLFLNPNLKHKVTKLQSKDFYQGLEVFLDFSDEDKLIGIEFSKHPVIKSE